MKSAPQKSARPPRKPPSLFSRAFRATLLVAGVVYAAAFLINLPPQNSPIAPLDIEQPVGLFTNAKLASLRDEPASCAQVIQVSRMETAPIADKKDGFCGFSNAVALETSYYPYSGPVRLSCPMAAALYMWEREVVAPAAAKHLTSAVTRVEQVGTYSCRRIYNRKEGRASEHATANAIDITGFKLASGEVVTVDKNWADGSPEAEFLKEVRNGGCEVFQAVLSPEYNEAHHDHLHLDMGQYRICS